MSTPMSWLLYALKSGAEATSRNAKARSVVRRYSGTDEAAWKKADDKLAEFRNQVNNQRSASSSIDFGYALDEWMRTTELEASTRKTYVGYLERNIRPVLGDVPAKKIDARTLENLYTDLRRCRIRCDGKTFIAKHKTEGEHDCTATKCTWHKCKPLAGSTVQQIHSIINGALAAAERWGWIPTNPARVARRPRRKPPEPDPPTPTQGGNSPTPPSTWTTIGHPRLARHDHRHAPR